MGAVGGDYCSAGGVIRNNIGQLFSTSLLWIVALLIISLGGLFSLRIIKVKIDVVSVVSLAIIGLYPFVWYSIIRNHSVIHSWMTYRNLAVTIFAISVMITYSLHRDGNEKLTIKENRLDC